ncbi:unnamed protein product [Mytilus coruscus]|uniref:Integrase catalytic domain-containing protein n=1 Tax=Mytilus coruscus TaxID=42192 RepID=A0A6J8A049_MYTCO|nr:unnamed protein product [Mytilus coruscus]
MKPLTEVIKDQFLDKCPVGNLLSRKPMFSSITINIFPMEEKEIYKRLCKICPSLTSSNGEKDDFKWDTGCDKSVTTSPIFAYLCVEKENNLDCDALGTGVGAVLSQVSDQGQEPRTQNGNKYVLVVTVYFTRLAETYRLPDIEAPTVTDKLVIEFICRYCLPVQIHSDQCAQLTSDIFIQLCKTLNICKTRNSPFHHHSSGLETVMKAQYQRRLIPVGTYIIIKEERCYLPKEELMELRDIWTTAEDTTMEE